MRRMVKLEGLAADMCDGFGELKKTVVPLVEATTTTAVVALAGFEDRLEALEKHTRIHV